MATSPYLALSSTSLAKNRVAEPSEHAQGESHMALIRRKRASVQEVGGTLATNTVRGEEIHIVVELTLGQSSGANECVVKLLCWLRFNGVSDYIFSRSDWWALLLVFREALLTPSSLCTFLRCTGGLAQDWHSLSTLAFPEFTHLSHFRSQKGALLRQG
jgi:hypothetical protein